MIHSLLWSHHPPLYLACTGRVCTSLRYDCWGLTFQDPLRPLRCTGSVLELASSPRSWPWIPIKKTLIWDNFSTRCSNKKSSCAIFKINKIKLASHGIHVSRQEVRNLVRICKKNVLRHYIFLHTHWTLCIHKYIYQRNRLPFWKSQSNTSYIYQHVNISAPYIHCTMLIKST